MHPPDCHVAHIEDAKPGNRFDRDMTDQERRAFANLILLCRPHHELVDKRKPAHFPTEVLTQWKVEREAEFPGVEETIVAASRIVMGAGSIAA